MSIPKVHIEGMGVSGSLLALFLDKQGVEVTWHDTDREQTAWRASTGAIYPAGSMKFGNDWDCWAAWAAWWARDELSRDHLERCSYWFNHTSVAPHEGRRYYRPEPVKAVGLHRSPQGVHSYHLNAQALVPFVRGMFPRVGAGEVDRRKCDWYVVSHGFGARMSHAYWGWTRLVELDYDRAVFGGAERPCFYFRRTRFEMAYAYPVPGTRWWYSGSNIIKQAPGKTRSLEMEPKYRKWREVFEDVAGGHVTVKDEGDYIEGWRPAPAKGDTEWLKVDRRRRQIQLRPLWNSGIRHFPHQLRAVCDALGLQSDCPSPPQLGS